MKNIIKLLAGLLFSAILFNSCEKDIPDLTYGGPAFIAFEDAAGALPENVSSNIQISVYLASTSPMNATINFDFDTVGLANPAIEGVDFILVNDSKTLTFASGEYFANIEIQSIDNDFYDKNKTVNIVLSSPTSGIELGLEGGASNAVYAFTVEDNEHPLALLIGQYNVISSIDLRWGDPALNETVITKSVDGDETALELDLYYSQGAVNTIFASVDLDAKTITFQSYQNFGTWGYGDVHFSKGDVDWIPYLTDPVIGTFDDSGNFTLDWWGGYFASGINEGLWWTLYETSTWTKQ